MIISKNPETGLWTDFVDRRTGETVGSLTNTHKPEDCAGRLCDIHDRRGEEPWAFWPLNWREDRGIMEMLDPKSRIGHPTPAQADFIFATHGDSAWAFLSHGCDGGCAGAYDQVAKKVAA